MDIDILQKLFPGSLQCGQCITETIHLRRAVCAVISSVADCEVFNHQSSGGETNTRQLSCGTASHNTGKLF